MWIKDNNKSAMITTVLLLMFYGFALHLVLFTPNSIQNFMFSEAGPYESLSPLLWMILAILSLIHCDFQLSTRLVMAISAVLFALREWDMHKQLFGVSFIKTRFYTDPNIAISYKVVGGLILLVIAYLAIYLLVQYFKALRVHTKEVNSAFRYLNLAFVLLVLSKILDRASSQMIELFHYHLPMQTQLIIRALEESTEMLLPAIFIIALMMYSVRKKNPVHYR
ncbi:hypothetical protein A3K93_08320 [Acinetobacter sp. NCu2D-2]|nr:hypothetical protein A3K93_08320 [Acinetobacter sp. NCu2D-2]